METHHGLVTLGRKQETAHGYRAARVIRDYTHSIELSGGRSLVFNLVTGLSCTCPRGEEGSARLLVEEYEGQAPAEPRLRRMEEVNQRPERRDLALVLVPTYGCNLSCSYCYEGKYTTSYVAWSEEEIAEVTAACVELARRESADMDRVDFIVLGGEVIRSETIAMVTELVRSLRAAGGRRFSAITNGFELAEHARAIAAAGVNEVQVTVDGVGGVHDDRRPSRHTDESSYERAIAGIRKALDIGLSVVVRVNIDQRNIPQLGELADELVRLGFFDHPRFYAYLYPVSSDFTGRQKFAGEVELAREVAAESARHPNVHRFLWSFHGANFLYSLRRGQKAPPKLRYCGATGRQYTLDVKKGVYACWFGTGKDGFQIGSFGGGELALDMERRAAWKGRGPLNMEPCSTCKWALICGGGCTFKAVGRTGDIYTPNCADFAGIFEAVGRLVYECHLGDAAAGEGAGAQDGTPSLQAQERLL